MITAGVDRMHYPWYVYHLGYKIQSDYNARTPNSSDEMRYRRIKSIHVEVKFLHDHGGTGDQDATQ